MSLSELAATDPETFDLVSTDLFDTLLLRDLTGQSERFAEISALVAKSLSQRIPVVDARALASLRLAVHELAYRAVSIERPGGEASLAKMHELQAHLLGGAEDLVALLRTAEFTVERHRLSANRPLLAMLDRFVAAGKRIVAVSDTYFATDDLLTLINSVVERNPIACVYASSDLGLTKHAGGIFAEVARREKVHPGRILHFGDDLHADVRMARAAGCHAVHLPRPAMIRGARIARVVLFRAVRSRMATISWGMAT